MDVGENGTERNKGCMIGAVASSFAWQPYTLIPKAEEVSFCFQGEASGRWALGDGHLRSWYSREECSKA